jgi:predicted ester cyclase
MDKEQIKNTALAVSKAILEARWDDLDNLLDDKFTYTGDGFVFTKDEYIGFMQDMKAAFSNLKMEFPHILVDGDMASIRFISTAVNTGKFMGAPANNKHLEINGIFIRKVKDGKVMQEWQTTDLLGVMKQIGFGALMGYSVFVGLFNVKQARPVRKK